MILYHYYKHDKKEVKETIDWIKQNFFLNVEQAQEIKGEGDAEAIRIYGEAFGKDPQFYEFVRTLETYEKTIDDNTTLILPSTAEILKYLSGDGISENRTNVAE